MEKEITSIGSLIENLNEDIGDYDEDVWFRGEACFDWKLLPGIFRSEKKISEEILLTRFRQSASMLIDTSPKSDFDWMFLMQHYGVQTRLLDWSESALASLYFAISEEDHLLKDGTLWMLKPVELNKLANIEDENKYYIPSFDDVHLTNYGIQSLKGNTRIQMNPIATIATRNNARIQAQQGVFTIHHSKDKPLEDYCEINKQIFKYRIPKNSKLRLKKELELLSFNRFSLFPELSSIGLLLKDKMK